MNQSIDDIDQRMILNIEYLAQNLQPMLLPVFIRNMHITRSRDETQEFIDNAGLIKYGSKYILQWFDLYKQELLKYNVPKRQLLPKHPKPQPRIEIQNMLQEQRILINPYRTKSKQAKQEQIQDYQLKPLTKLQRPYFSPKTGSYEIDLAFAYDTHKHREQIYLFAININTKYLVVIPIIDKSANQLKNALTQLINTQYVNNIRSDGEKGLTGTTIKKFCKDNNITLYFNSSPFTHHNRVVDRVIRTIRDGFGQDSDSMANNQLMQQMITIYNNNKHEAFDNKYSPTQIQQSRDLEGSFIRYKLAQLDQAKQQQLQQHLFEFKIGNIIMIHLDYGRTKIKTYKIRRNFNELATFIAYKNGNVICKLLRSNGPINQVELPIYYCKYISENINSLPVNYKSQFLINN